MDEEKTKVPEKEEAPTENKPTPKTMRPLEDIMAEYIATGESNLTPNEERLLDRQLYEKTGKHLDKFKEVKPKPKDDIPTVVANGGGYAEASGSPDKSGKVKPAKGDLTITNIPQNIS